MIHFFLNSGWFTFCVRKKLGVKELTVYATHVQFNKCTLSQRQRDGQQSKLFVKGAVSRPDSAKLGNYKMPVKLRET